MQCLFGISLFTVENTYAKSCCQLAQRWVNIKRVPLTAGGGAWGTTSSKPERSEIGVSSSWHDLLKAKTLSFSVSVTRAASMNDFSKNYKREQNWSVTNVNKTCQGQT